MASPIGVLPNAVKSCYDTLVDAFQAACNASDCGDVEWPRPLQSRFRHGKNNIATFDCWLYLKGWKARSSSGKRRVHIVVQAQEEILTAGGSFVLVRSTVRVNYFDVDGEKAKLLHSIRFDYGPESELHPRFHAQLMDDSIIATLPEDETEEIDFGYELDQSRVVCFKNSRIPTSDMTLSSVLLCLAADHLDGQFFREFMEKVVEIQCKMPQPTFDRMRQSIANEPGHLRSSHWFSHDR